MESLHSGTNGSWPVPQPAVMNASDEEVEAFLEKQNLRYFSSLWPSVAYLLGLASLGLVGNSLVFLVYLKKLKTLPMTTYILAMSVCDLLTNVFSLPMEVTEIRLHVNYPADWLCRVSWAVISFLVLLSGSLLIAVAYDRQTLVCRKRTGSPFRFRRERNFIVACVVLAAVVSAPFLGLLELQQVEFEGTGVTGAACSYVKDSVCLHVVNYIHNGLVVFGIAVLCYSYGRVGWHLLRHRKRKNKAGHPSGSASDALEISCDLRVRADADLADISQKMDSGRTDLAGQETRVHTALPHTLSDPTSLATSPHAPTHTPEENPKTSTGQEQTSFRRQRAVCLLSPCCPVFTCWGEPFSDQERGEVDSTPTPTPTPRGRGRGQKIPNRTTLMLFVLTVIFCLNYLPYLLIVILRTARSEQAVIGQLGLNVYAIMLRSLYINSAVNPIVYGVYSPLFRKECRHLFGSLAQKLAAVRPWLCRQREYEL